MQRRCSGSNWVAFRPGVPIPSPLKNSGPPAARPPPLFGGASRHAGHVRHAREHVRHAPEVFRHARTRAPRSGTLPPRILWISARKEFVATTAQRLRYAAGALFVAKMTLRSVAKASRPWRKLGRLDLQALGKIPPGWDQTVGVSAGVTSAAARPCGPCGSRSRRGCSGHACARACARSRTSLRTSPAAR